MSEGGKKVRFIRKGGRVIPIRGNKSQAGYKDSKRFDGGPLPSVKRTSMGVAALAGAATGLTLKKLGGFSLAGAALGGVAVAAGFRSTKYTDRAKGESKLQTAQRVAVGNRKYLSRLRKERK